MTRIIANKGLSQHNKFTNLSKCTSMSCFSFIYFTKCVIVQLGIIDHPRKIKLDNDANIFVVVCFVQLFYSVSLA